MIGSWKAQKGDEARLSIFDPRMYKTWRVNGTYYLRVMAISIVALWLPLCLFYGAAYRRSVNVNHIHIEVIDLDKGPIGNAVTNAAMGALRNNNNPTWRVRRDIDSIQSAKEWIKNHGWGGVVVNPGASDRLVQALNGRPEYNPDDALTVIVSSGRNPIGEPLFAQPALLELAIHVKSRFAIRSLTDFKRSGATATPNLNALLNPVSYTTVDVSPYAPPLAPVLYLFPFLVGFLCTIGMLITWKMTTFTFFLKARFLHVWTALLSLVLAWACIIGLYGSLAILAFKGPDYGAEHEGRTYTAGRFFSIWFTIMAVITALALWNLAWFMLLPPDFIGLLSVSTVIPNVVSCLVPVELTPRFFRWFYATPFFNGAMLFRYIISGAYKRIGENVGIILGEIAIMACALGVTAWLRQYMAVNGICDVPGFIHGNPFYNSPVPYYKAEVSAPMLMAEKDDSERRALHIADSHNDATSLKDGNLGV
ncbi:hypothetical protein EC988_005228 [Linderina pennispora]|nr:hypothetical protein EC988_005228 [Linderina pennispora]